MVEQETAARNGSSHEATQGGGVSADRPQLREDGQRGAAALGNTTKFTDEFVPAVLVKTQQNQQVREILNPETGEISRFVYNEKAQSWDKEWDGDEALLERWLLQRHAQRILSRPEYWYEREKVVGAPYTDLTAKVAYTDLQTRQVVKVLATSIGLPRVRNKLHAIQGAEFSDIQTREVTSTEAVNVAPKFRVVSCYRNKVPGEKPELWKNRESGSVALHKVAVCGSVWTCPLCSAKINRMRREEISDAYNAVSDVDGSCYMLTFTIKHGIGDELGELLAKFKDAMQHLQKSQAFKEATRSTELKRPRADSMPYLGYIGRIANLEVTHGLRNGWHPHEHHLWFFRRDLTAREITLLRNRLFDAWATACKAVGLPAPVKTIKVGNSVRHLGLDIRKAFSAQEYLTKFGQYTAEGEKRERRWGPENELAGAHVKAARLKGKTPFQLLYDGAQGDKFARERFVEFANAFLGRHQLQFSRTLKAFLAALPKAIVVDDSETGDKEHAARLEGDSDLLYQMTDHQFDKIVRNKAHALVMVICRHNGLQAALDFIAGLPLGEATRRPRR